MDDSTKTWAQRALELPPAYFYSILAIVAAVVFLWGISGNRSPEETNQSLGGFDLLDEPIPAIKVVDSFQAIKKATPVENLIDTEMSRVFESFEHAIKDVVQGRQLNQPAWVAANFSGLGIDQNQFQERFKNEQLVVRRWRTHKDAPQFIGQEGFVQFLKNLGTIHSGLDQFRIDLKAYASEVDNDVLKIRLVAEAFGNSEQAYEAIADTGFRMRAIQSTSIWETTWRRNESAANSLNQFTLLSAKVLAKEVVSSLLQSDQLFVDCTASILKDTDASKQLQYGVDQWSRKVPGIDINGTQGIAIGDANNDGMDDLYVCQSHGLQNRLLIQNADGTVNDQSEQSRTDILDQTNTALFIDIDNDGDQDLVVGTDETLVLLSNDGRGLFQIERRIAVGRNARGLSAADFDLDGDLDLFVCKFEDINRQSDVLMFPTNLKDPTDGGRNVLLRNDEGYRFTDVTEIAGLSSENHKYSRSAVWFDHDRDGDPDLYVANEFSGDQLWENDGGTFSEVSQTAGIRETGRHTSASVADFNSDGMEDVFVATDVSLAGYRVLKGLANVQSTAEPSSSSPTNRPADSDQATNEEDSVKTFAIANSGLAVESSSTREEDLTVYQEMLTESQIRYNMDGRPYHSYFLRSPIFNSESAYGTAAVDLNNDGKQDLVVANGGFTRVAKQDLTELFYSQAFRDTDAFVWKDQSKTPVSRELQLTRTAHEMADLCRSGYSLGAAQRNRCYLNIGSGFANVSALTGVDFPDDARSVSVVDWDQDGDQDLIFSCRSAPQLRVLSNQLNRKDSSVAFDLEGTESNRDAIGARVELFLEGAQSPMVRTVQAGSGALSQSSKRILFGIPQRAEIQKAVVHWPSGLTQAFESITAGAEYNVIEGRELLKETVSERFGLGMRQDSLIATLAVPEPETRSYFYPRAPLTTLQVQVEENKWANLTPQNKPMLMLFWSRDAESDEWLRRLKSDNSELKETELDVMAILVDPGSTVEHQWRYALQTMNSLEYDGSWSTLAPSSNQLLEYFYGEWFNHRHPPECPFALLVNADQRVCAQYTLDSYSASKLIADASRSASDDFEFRRAYSHTGTWIADQRETKTNRLRVRFHELGYARVADELDQLSDRQRAHELTQKAIELGAQGDFVVAQRYFQKAISINSECIGAFIGEAELLTRIANSQPADDAKRYQMQVRAMELFDAALSINPVNLNAVLGKAQVAIELDRRTEALEQLQSFLVVEPKRYEVHALVGRLLFNQKKYEEAAMHLALAFDYRPNLPHLAGDLGFLYLVSGQDKDARKFLRLAHRLQPSDENVLRLLAESEFITGNFEAAVELFQQFNQLDPNHRRSKNVLAWLLATCPYEDHRDGKAAVTLISPMVELFGDTSPSTMEIYAASYAEVGEFDKAIEFQIKAIKLINGDVAAEAYSDEQRKGMTARLELYRRNRPYRTADVSQIPIPRPQRVE
ncbi:MAG: FG-GAP-like repeat-containing protein [Planctomycetota bacterium]